MDRMRSMFDDPFFGGFPSNQLALSNGRQERRDMERRGERQRNNQVAINQDPFGMMMGSDMFSGMSSMMQNMNSMMSNMHQSFDQVRNNPNAQVFTQSAVMSYSNDGRGQPKVYQASTATRQAPGGVRETRRMYRDSERGVEKMAVGHHLGSKAHVVAKQRDLRTGQVEENRDLINLDEEETENFEQEWRSRTQQAGRAPAGRAAVGGPSRSRYDQLPGSSKPSHSYQKKAGRKH